MKKMKLSGEETASLSGSNPLPISARIVPNVSVSAILLRRRVVLLVHERVIARVHTVHDQIFAHVTKLAVSLSCVSAFPHLAEACRAIHHSGPSASPFINAYEFVRLAGRLEIRDVYGVIGVLVDMLGVCIFIERQMARFERIDDLLFHDENQIVRSIPFRQEHNRTCRKDWDRRWRQLSAP